MASSSLMVSPSQYGVLNLDENFGDYHTVSVTFPKNEVNDSCSEIAMRTQTFQCSTAYCQAMAQLYKEENVD